MSPSLGNIVVMQNDFVWHINEREQSLLVNKITQSK